MILEEFTGMVARPTLSLDEGSSRCPLRFAPGVLRDGGGIASPLGTRRLSLARRGGRRRAEPSRSVEGLLESLLAKAFS